ncbi:MAG: response regulator transcription factor [Cytophagales bacterium]|nr:response regulator transcription factor [Cytophagales bacterium]
MDSVKRKLLIVDDHIMIRDGITVMLESKFQKRKLIIHEAQSGEEAIEKVNNNQYDAVLMDFQLPKLNGAETTQILTQKYPDIKILALSNNDEYSNIMLMLKNGAVGYVLKNITPVELHKAIETVIEGKLYYSSDVAVKLIGDVRMSRVQKAVARDANHKLSVMEMKVIKLMISTDMPIAEIANMLHISPRTASSHRTSIFTKLKITNRAALIRWARDNKYV